MQTRAGWISVVAAAGIALFACGAVWAQAGADQGNIKPQMMAHDADPGWDVVSVRQSDPNATRDFIDVQGRHEVFGNTTVETMLIAGYGVQKSQIIGAPGWVKTERFDVDGVADTDGQPDVPQYQSLIRKLLEQRFGLKFHREQRELPVLAITVAKQGPKLTPSKGSPNGLPNMDGGGGNIRESDFTNTSMHDLALLLMLNGYVERPVVDRTALNGPYDFKLKWTVDETQTTTPDSPPGLFTAMQQQLGLKLEPTRAPADVLVIDTIERPGAN